MFFGSSYDPYRFGSTSPSYANMRRQELARRQRAMEEERQRKAKIERRRRIEEEMARRRHAEMWQNERREMEWRQRDFAQRKKTPSCRVVQGPDGRLYRVSLGDNDDGVKLQSNQNSIQKDVPPNQIIRGVDGRLYKAPYVEQDDVVKSQTNKKLDTNVSTSENDSTSDDSASDEESSSSNTDETMDDDDDNESATSLEWEECQDHDDGSQILATDAVLLKENDAPSHEETIVEDVPDEEDGELRELRSIWRNRVPSPGHWMEPVETYLRQ